MIDRPSTRDCSMSVGGPVHVVGAEHDVDVAGPLEDRVPVLLGQAAADDDLHARAGWSLTDFRCPSVP